MKQDDAPNLLCAVLLGQAASTELAVHYAEQYRGCPYVSSYTAAGRVLLGVFVLPLSKRWWIEIPQERPHLLGLEKVEVFFPHKQFTVSSPWSRGDVLPTLATPPCGGAACSSCLWYGAACAGCPATRAFMSLDAEQR